MTRLLSTMKMVGSSRAMYCFTVIGIMAFVNTAWGACELDYKFGLFGCPEYKRIYPIYKKLESILTNDTETLYLMRQAFFPPQTSHILETERVNVVLMRVCWIPNETRPPPACNSLDSNNQTATETRCKNFRWSRSPALNMIAVEQLLVFDPILTALIYSRFVGSRIRFFSAFDISPDLFSCTPSEDDLIQATVLLLTWVSVTTYIHSQKHPCSCTDTHIALLQGYPPSPSEYCN